MDHEARSDRLGRERDVAVVASREQQASRAPSLVVASARGGESCGTAAIGLADVGGHVVADPSVPYRIGSITKTFAAAVVLRLVEDGVLELDQPTGRYLGEAPFSGVPVRALLAHSGGVQREVPGDMWTSMRGPDAADLRGAIGGSTRRRVPTFTNRPLTLVVSEPWAARSEAPVNSSHA